jgi:hypothetical protein
MPVERGGVPQPEQPEEQQQQDLFVAKGDQRKGREFSGTPLPEGAEQELEAFVAELRQNSVTAEPF